MRHRAALHFLLCIKDTYSMRIQTARTCARGDRSAMRAHSVNDAIEINMLAFDLSDTITTIATCARN